MIGKFVGAACILAISARAVAWGPDGHQIVAAIAEQRLSDEAKAAVTELLDGQTMTEVSSWADRARRQEEYRWTGPMHYANLAPGATKFDMARDCAPAEDGAPGCVVSAIEHYRSVLEDDAATHEAKTEALKFLIHFVGDVHQPLHVSFERDRGGNSIKVTFLGHESNLHRVWDEQLIESRELPWREYMESLSSKITVEQQLAWAETDPAVWATESYQLAVSNAYAVPADGVLDEAYVSRNIGVVERRLSQGGVRLALVLNEIFAPEAAPQDGVDAATVPAASDAVDGSSADGGEDAADE